MKVNFKSKQTSTVHVANGNYKRSFNPAEQPFEVTDEEWATLEPFDLFEQVKEAAPANENAKGEKDSGGSPDATTDQDSQHSSSKRAANKSAAKE